MAFAGVFDKFAFGLVSTAAILIDDHIAVAHEERGDFFARHRHFHVDRALGTAANMFAVWRALQDHRKSLLDRLALACRQVDVGCKMHAVTHGNHDIAQHDHVASGILSMAAAIERHDRRIDPLACDFEVLHIQQ